MLQTMKHVSATIEWLEGSQTAHCQDPFFHAAAHFYFQEEFEKTFAVYDENVTFQYFKSFRRARVNFSSPLFSANARIDLHEADVLGQRIKCFFFQVSTVKV